jgi:hypothetical protein
MCAAVLIALAVQVARSDERVGTTARRTDDIASIVLASRNLGELRRSWPRFAGQDLLELIWHAPAVLFEELLEDPSSNRRWEAVYHYKSMTDAGATLAFAWACLDVAVDHPTLFRDRYANGDDRAEMLMYWAMRSDGSERWGNLYGAAKAHRFKDVESMYQWLFTTLESAGPPPRTPEERLRRRRFVTHARKTLAAAQAEMKANMHR